MRELVPPHPLCRVVPEKRPRMVVGQVLARQPVEEGVGVAHEAAERIVQQRVIAIKERRHFPCKKSNSSHDQKQPPHAKNHLVESTRQLNRGAATSLLLHSTLSGRSQTHMFWEEPDSYGVRTHVSHLEEARGAKCTSLSGGTYEIVWALPRITNSIASPPLLHSHCRATLHRALPL